MRELPQHTAALVTELIFGESYEVIRIEGEWLFIRIEDGYEGFIRSNQHWTGTMEGDFTILKSPAAVPISHNNYTQSVPLSPGSRIYEKRVHPLWKIGRIEENTTLSWQDFALQFLYAPYIWGGKTLWGIDCSGLCQLVMRMRGVSLPRNSSQQAEYGETISFISEALPGDLAFFDNEEGKITHVGILLGSNAILHASGHTRIDSLDHEGIYHPELKKYTHKLRILKRHQAE